MAVVFDKSKLALLVVDVQNAFCEWNKSIHPMVGRLETFISEVRQFHVPIIWIKMKLRDEHAEEIFRLVPEADPVFLKSKENDFSTAPLLNNLEARGINTLIISGVYASFCVFSTVHDASNAGFDVVVPFDLVADKDVFRPPFDRTCYQNLLENKCAVVESSEILACV